ncbi:MAG: sensor histidine kinase [Hyphomonadaceae bacterium]
MALLLGLAMLPAGAIAMQAGLNAVSVREAAYEEALGRRALQSISAERAVIDEMREVLRVLAATPALQQVNRENCAQLLGNVAQRYGYLASMAVSDDSGLVLCSVPELPAGMRVPMTDLRRRALARDAFTMGYVERSVLSGESVLGAFEPVRDAAGNRRALISAAIRVSELRQLIDSRRALDGARAAIIDFTGQVIAESAIDRTRAYPGLPSPAQVRDRFGSEPRFVPVRNGQAVVAPLHAPDLYIVLAWSSDTPSWRRWISIAMSLAAPVIVWALAIAAGWFAIEFYIVRPLSSIESAARGFARGEDVADGPTLQNAPDEIRSLRRTLAAMAKTLRGREQRLVEALGEERALLREVHHRVKNNLQMVASLLNIQARGARDESEAWGLARAHDRVQLLALVHQRIYASGELRELRFDDLVADIARNLVQSRGAAAKDINLVMHLGEARGATDRAVPMSFLIGEAVSGALDVLADAGACELQLMLQQDDDGEVRFAVESDVANVRGSPGPGSRLIDAFARQLGAAVGREPEKPFRIWVRMPPTPRDAD